MRIRTYSEFRRLQTFEDRFDYLQLNGAVGIETFGSERYLNQRFYTSQEWRHVRNHVIARDSGLDLGCEDYPIFEKIIIHHMNPITKDDVLHNREYILDPEYLITTTHDTHNALHYGNRLNIVPVMIERRPGDTKLW